jgi:hypothetical protein
MLHIPAAAPTPIDPKNSSAAGSCRTSRWLADGFFLRRLNVRQFHPLFIESDVIPV